MICADGKAGNILLPLSHRPSGFPELDFTVAIHFMLFMVRIGIFHAAGGARMHVPRDHGSKTNHQDNLKRLKNMLFGHNGIASKVFRTRKSLAAQGTGGRDSTDV